MVLVANAYQAGPIDTPESCDYLHFLFGNRGMWFEGENFIIMFVCFSWHACQVFHTQNDNAVQ
jgi:hypothetical protein